MHAGVTGRVKKQAWNRGNGQTCCSATEDRDETTARMPAVQDVIPRGRLRPPGDVATPPAWLVSGCLCGLAYPVLPYVYLEFLQWIWLVPVLRALRHEFGRVDVERVLSGPGLVNLHRFTHGGPTCPSLCTSAIYTALACFQGSASLCRYLFPSWLSKAVNTLCPQNWRFLLAQFCPPYWVCSG